MNKLSLVLITFNEESNIEKCLQSVINVVDEIIVVDSFSTDNTKIICQKFNVRFFERKWEGYSKAKNFGNEQASSEYILSLDADEVLSENLKNSILKVKNNLNSAYSFNRLTNYAGKWIKNCGWYPDKKIRIFPKTKARWEGDFVHEVLVLDKDLVVNHLTGDLFHFSFKSIDDHKQRSEKYAELHAKSMLEKGVRFSFIKQLISPLARFIKDYFIKTGFLDGKAGFTICLISAKAVFLKYKKYRNYKRRNSS